MTYEPKTLKRWTRPDHYAGAEWPEYFGSSVGRHRDSDALARANFDAMLSALGGESETVIVVHEGHWAVGWVEWIAIHESDAAALEKADEIAAELEQYPVINDDLFGEYEQADADETWKKCYSPAERVEYIRKYRDQFKFHDFRDMLGCVRGEYFAGYPGELLY